jgi:hypothetical protein
MVDWKRRGGCFVYFERLHKRRSRFWRLWTIMLLFYTVFYNLYSIPTLNKTASAFETEIPSPTKVELLGTLVIL